MQGFCRIANTVDSTGFWASSQVILAPPLSVASIECSKHVHSSSKRVHSSSALHIFLKELLVNVKFTTFGSYV